MKTLKTSDHDCSDFVNFTHPDYVLAGTFLGWVAVLTSVSDDSEAAHSSSSAVARGDDRSSSPTVAQHNGARCSRSTGGSHPNTEKEAAALAKRGGELATEEPALLAPLSPAGFCLVSFETRFPGAETNGIGATNIKAKYRGPDDIIAFRLAIAGLDATRRRSISPMLCGISRPGQRPSGGSGTAAPKAATLDGRLIDRYKAEKHHRGVGYSPASMKSHASVLHRFQQSAAHSSQMVVIGAEQSVLRTNAGT